MQLTSCSVNRRGKEIKANALFQSSSSETPTSTRLNQNETPAVKSQKYPDVPLSRRENLILMKRTREKHERSLLVQNILYFLLPQIQTSIYWNCLCLLAKYLKPLGEF